jgi:hypothetical protein
MPQIRQEFKWTDRQEVLYKGRPDVSSACPLYTLSSGQETEVQGIYAFADDSGASVTIYYNPTGSLTASDQIYRLSTVASGACMLEFNPPIRMHNANSVFGACVDVASAVRLMVLGASRKLIS